MAAEAAILVVSAYGSAEFSAESLEARCDGYVVMPEDSEQMAYWLRLLAA